MKAKNELLKTVEDNKVAAETKAKELEEHRRGTPS